MSPALVPARPEDAGRLAAFFTHFPPIFVTPWGSPEQSWRLENPANADHAPKAWIFEPAAGEVAGFLDSAPAKLEAGGRTLDASWVTSLLVRPDFQARGLPPWLVKAWAASTDLCLAFGTTNDSRALFEHLGWKNLGTVTYYRRLLDPGPFVADRWRNRAGRLASAALRPAAWMLEPAPVREGERLLGWELLEELDAFWGRVGGGLGVAVRRDRAYVAWRYRDRPEGNYELLGLKVGGRLEGVAVLRHRVKRGKVMGLLVDLWGSRAHLPLLVAHAVRRFSERKAHVVHVFTGHAELDRVLKASGFRAKPTSLYVMYYGRPGLELPPDLQDLRRWWVLQGDADQDRLHLPGIPSAGSP